MDWGGFSLARRVMAICAVAFACLVSPTSAAEDPLLSGYSGPGGGEQVVIGSGVIPPKNGNGGIRRDVRSQPPAQQQASSPGSGSGDDSKAGSSEDSSGGSSPQPRQPAPVAVAAKPTYPNTVSSASSLPLSRADMVLIAGAAVAALLVGVALVRLRGISA